MTSSRIIRQSFIIKKNCPQPSSSLDELMTATIERFANLDASGRQREIKYLERATHLGSWKACYILAKFYQTGFAMKGVEIKVNLDFASECLLWGARKSAKPEIFFALLQTLAQANKEFPAIQKNLAACHYYGFGTNKNLEACFLSFEQNIEALKENKNCSKKIFVKKLKAIKSLYRNLLRLHLKQFELLSESQMNEEMRDTKHVILLLLQSPLNVEDTANILLKYPSPNSLAIKHAWDYLDANQSLNCYEQILSAYILPILSAENQKRIACHLELKPSAGALDDKDNAAQSAVLDGIGLFAKNHLTSHSEQSEVQEINTLLRFSPSAVTSTPT